MRRAVSFVAALGLGLTLMLSACVANSAEPQITDQNEPQVEDQNGIDYGSGGSLPDGWPAEVPTLEGKIVVSYKWEDGYRAIIKVGSFADAQKGFTDLTDAGYTQVSASQLYEGIEGRSFENGTWNVSLTIGPIEDGTAEAEYVVSPAN